MSAEARDRPRPKGETESQAEQRDISFIMEKRFDEWVEKFVELHKSRLLCKIHFGPTAVISIDEFFNVCNLIYVMLLQAKHCAGSVLPAEAATFQNILSSIRGSEDQTDKLSRRIASAVAKLEDICSPYLKGPEDILDRISRLVARQRVGKSPHC
jgi:hypothetical protein